MNPFSNYHKSFLVSKENLPWQKLTFLLFAPFSTEVKPGNADASELVVALTLRQDHKALASSSLKRSSGS